MIVTKKAQELSAPAVLGNNQIVENFSLYKNIGSKGAVVFFYPKDFTFVARAKSSLLTSVTRTSKSVASRLSA